MSTSAVEEPPLGIEIPEGQTTGDAPKKPIEDPLAKMVTPPDAVTSPEIVGEINDEEEIVAVLIVPPEIEGTVNTPEAMFTA